MWVSLNGEQGVFPSNKNICLATLAAAVRVGVSGIHPKSEGTEILVSVYEGSEPFFGAYTLSAICYPLTYY